MKQYALGLDFGTLSVRALFLDLNTGEEAAVTEYSYPHGVMTECLPDGTKLPPDFALEHPQDFLDGLTAVVREGMAKLGLRPEQVVGIGLDVTSATALPVDEAGEPLCFRPEFAGRPQAWMKLWKHHGAGEMAQRLLAAATELNEPWLPYCGGSISSELFIPKAIELAVKDPEVFNRTYNLLEAADWLTWKLTGRMVRSISMAGCNSMYRMDTGYPSKACCMKAYPEAENVPDKLKGDMLPLGSCVGGLLPEMAKKLGLRPGTPVGVGHIDSHVGAIGCGASKEGDMVAVIGTSACCLLNARDGSGIEGIYSAAQDANIPGLFGYEGGQNCVGDMFAWFVDNCVGMACYQAAQGEGKDIYTYLEEKAAALKPGESGLLALDWFNGVRSPLMDYSLTGTIAGLTIRTRPEEIYRALLESVAFGCKRIMDAFTQAGKPVVRIIAGGGIPMKNRLLMQIYADVCDRDIYLCTSKQSCALGSALLGVAAARRGTLPELIDKYVKRPEKVYHPIGENVRRYQALYTQYCRLSEQMAESGSVMRALRTE